VPLTAADLLTGDFIRVDCGDTVSRMLGEMARKHQHFALVFDGKKYLGLASRKWLLRSRINANEMKVYNLVGKRTRANSSVYVPRLAPGTPLKEACRLMATADARGLPVLGKAGGIESVIGVVLAKDIVGRLRDAYKGVAAIELASRPVVTVSADDPLDKALRAMYLKNIDRMPVVDASGAFLGMLTLVDVLEKHHIWPYATGQRQVRPTRGMGGKGRSLDSGERPVSLGLPVRNFMSPSDGTDAVPSGAKLSDVFDVMARNDQSSVVLLEGGRPAGIITVKDILEDYAEIRPSRKTREF
jgi:CBS domain-containing protein